MNMDILFTESLFRERLYENLGVPSGVKMAISIGGAIYLLLTLTWLTARFFTDAGGNIVAALRTVRNRVTEGVIDALNFAAGMHAHGLRGFHFA